MIEPDRLIAAPPQQGEQQVDHAIRPRRLGDYIGQPRVREQLDIFISAARQRGAAAESGVHARGDATAGSPHVHARFGGGARARARALLSNQMICSIKP